MKITIENLGVLRFAELEFGKLTVICGKNNTGKTYATYALYGLLKMWRRLVVDLVPTHYRRELVELGTTTIDLDNAIVKRWDHHLESVAARYKAFLPNVLAADPERFSETKISIEIPEPQSVLAEQFEGVKGVDGRQESQLLTYKKNANASTIVFTVLNQDALLGLPNEAIDLMANEVLQDLFFARYFPSVFMTSTERTGAAIFHNELNFGRTRLLEAIAGTMQGNRQVKAQDMLPAMFPEFSPRYAYPVRDNVDFVNSLTSLSSDKSPLFKEEDDIFEDFAEILGGEYKITKSIVHFVPKKGRVKLRLGETSSAVRSLLDVGFYIQHMAKPGDLFMIDEPELNLHPENQRRIARLIGRLVNRGIKVFITTHSDYIAKELNTLTLLACSGATEVGEGLGYKQDEALKSSDVKVFVAEASRGFKRADEDKKVTGNVIRSISPLEDGGFDWPTFDPTIEEQAKVQRAIWDAINA